MSALSWDSINEYGLEKKRNEAPDVLAKQVSTTLESAERLAADNRYNHDHKAKEIASIIEAGKSAIEAHAAQLVEGLQTDIAAARGKSNLPIMPDGLDAAALTYAVQVLPEQWKDEKHDAALLDRWSAAVLSGDKITAKISLDMLPRFLRRREVDRITEGKSPELLASVESTHTRLMDQERVDQLTADTIAILRNADQRAAAEKLTDLQAKLERITSAQLTARLNMNMIYDRRSGKVVTDTAAILGRGRAY